MPHVLYIDTFEPKGVEALFPSTITATRQYLVGSGYADYMWHCGHLITLEHKTIEQAISEMGGRLDEQLRRYTQNADEVGLVIDGVATPVDGEPACLVWQQRGAAWIPRRKVHRPWEAFQSYLWRLDKEGITVYQAPTMGALCLSIASFVHNSFKPEHKTLRRYIKTKPIHMPDEDTDKASYIRVMMSHRGVGEAMARRLLDIYKTPWGVYQSHPLDGLWPSNDNLFWSIMREVGKTS